MYYRLTIIKVEPNPAYDAEKAKERQQYGGYGPIEPPEKETQQLTTTLDEEEWISVKRAMLTIWK